MADENENVDGIVDNIAEALEKVLRPKSATGETQPAGTVEVKLTDDTKMYLIKLAGGVIIGQGLVTLLTNKLNTKK